MAALCTLTLRLHSKLVLKFGPATVPSLLNKLLKSLLKDVFILAALGLHCCLCGLSVAASGSCHCETGASSLQRLPPVDEHRASSSQLVGSRVLGQ